MGKKSGLTDTESTQKPKKNKKSTAAGRWLKTAIVAAIVLLVALNWSWLSPVAILQRCRSSQNDSGVQGKYPADIAQASIAGLCALEDSGFLATDSGCFLLLDNHPIYFSYTTPTGVVKFGHRNALIYEHGGKNYTMYGKTGQQFQRLSESPLKSAAVAKNGLYCLLTNPTPYSTDAVIYSVAHVPLFTLHLSDPAYSDAALSLSADELALLKIDTVDGRLTSTVVVYDTARQDPVFTYELVGEMVLDFKYDSNDRLCLVTDRSAVFFDAKHEVTSRYVYEESLSSFSLSLTGSAALMFDTGSVTTGKLIVLVNSGGVVFSERADYFAKSVSVYGKSVVYISNGSVYMLNEDGTPRGYVECQLDTDRVLITKKSVFIVNSTKINIASHSDFDND